MIDHDRLFKELIGTFFPEFIELFFPAIAQDLDRTSLIKLNKEVFTDVTSGDKYIADLVMQAKLKGQDSQFLIHIEHQGRPEADFNRRMFRYFSRLHDTYGFPVYPIVIFSHASPKRPEIDTYRVEFPDCVVLEFKYRVIQLNRLQWRDFAQRPNPIASALMAKMRMKQRERPQVKVTCLNLLAKLGLNPAQVQLISGFVDTYLPLNRQEQTQFQAELDKIEPEEKEGVMQIVTSWMEEGLQQGRQEEALALVLRLLARRIGPVELQLQQQIQQLSVSQLEALGEALLDFRDRTDLVTWLDNHG